MDNDFILMEKSENINLTIKMIYLYYQFKNSLILMITLIVLVSKIS